MRYRVFTYTIPPPEEPEDLNSFLASKKILSVRSEITVKGNTPYLMFIVEYLESSKGSGTGGKPRVDYREKLSDEDFQIFSRLRDLRKSVAEKEGVPVYGVFTNAQLAQMVENRTRSAGDMLEISGVGKGKVDKYGQKFIELITELMPSEKEG